jgi:cell pole-organizing protein PopZ
LRESPVAKIGQDGGAAIVPLTSIVSHLAEARFKAPASFEPAPARAAPVAASTPFAATPVAAAPEAESVAGKSVAGEATPAKAEPAEPVAAAPAAPTPAPRRAPAPPSRAAAEPLEAPLLSSASGARINASFEALAESMMLRDPDIIERLTREMLRPMLKSWLDDNLPTVVERLVRAEIERIARGRG